MLRGFKKSCKKNKIKKALKIGSYKNPSVMILTAYESFLVIQTYLKIHGKKMSFRKRKKYMNSLKKIMKLKKALCVYLTIVLFLTGCENLKSQLRGNQNTDASADQSIKSGKNELAEVNKSVPELKSELAKSQKELKEEEEKANWQNQEELYDNRTLFFTLGLLSADLILICWCCYLRCSCC
ncbi:hypothetical protein AGMMS49573_03790 [Endomicrobiia bacterium]|nr:hypothetical protein AGMMS49573_03790 [Endomicrobiia bacterium]